jgi:DNA-binding CsgD family transcriptional regulator
MRLSAQGLRSKDIADRLRVDLSTVASAFKSIRRNLNAETQLQAMAKWAVLDHIEANEE